MRFAIVGAKGFVGAALVRRLVHAGHDVVALDLRPGPGRLADVADDVEWVVGDGSTQEALLAAVGRRPIDGIYYGTFFQHPPGGLGLESELRVMVTSTWSVFGLARGLDVGRIVFPSSTAVHGSQPPGDGLLDETSRVAPFGLYGAYKLLCEEVGVEINRALGDNVVTSLRLPAVYGPGASIASRRVNVPAVTAARGTVGEVDYRSDVRVCVAHVDDVAAALEAAFDAKVLPHSVYDVGGLDVSFGEIADAAAQVVPTARTRFGDATDMPLPNAIDSSRARADLGVVHRSLLAGTESIVEYERAEQTRVQEPAAT